MTNRDVIVKDIERHNEIGIQREDWVVYLLTQLVLTTARILDHLEAESEEEVTK